MHPPSPTSFRRSGAVYLFVSRITLLVTCAAALGVAEPAPKSQTIQRNPCPATLTGESKPKVRAHDAYEAFLAFRSANDQRQWPSELNEIPLSRIKNKTKITDTTVEYIGEMNRGLFTGFIDGRKVFIKICLRTLPFSTEAHLTKLLSDMGLGPHFFGLVTEYGKPVGIVTEFIEGTHLYNSAIQNTRRGKMAYRFLSDLGIYPKDLQYRVSDTRMWIVDPGQFTTFTYQAREWAGFREFKQAWDELNDQLTPPFPRTRPISPRPIDPS